MTNSKAFNLILSPEEQGLLTACKQALFTRNSSYAFRYLLHNWEKILPKASSKEDYVAADERHTPKED